MRTLPRLVPLCALRTVVKRGELRDLGNHGGRGPSEVTCYDEDPHRRYDQDQVILT